jgi:hypothetical protein
MEVAMSDVIFGGFGAALILAMFAYARALESL